MSEWTRSEMQVANVCFLRWAAGCTPRDRVKDLDVEPLLLHSEPVRWLRCRFQMPLGEVLRACRAGIWPGGRPGTGGSPSSAPHGMLRSHLGVLLDELKEDTAAREVWESLLRLFSHGKFVIAEPLTLG